MVADGAPLTIFDLERQIAQTSKGGAVRDIHLRTPIKGVLIIFTPLRVPVGRYSSRSARSLARGALLGKLRIFGGAL